MIKQTKFNSFQKDIQNFMSYQPKLEGTPI